MTYKVAATIKFQDAITSDDAVAIVRYGEGCVFLGLSIKSDGDIEIGMSKGEITLLIDALKAASEGA